MYELNSQVAVIEW